jgi:alpha-1,2-mannosyltransferase
MGYRFSQPPFAGILLSPIAFLPAAQLANAWSVLVLLGGCALAYVIAPDVARRLSTYWPPDRWRRTPILPLVALALISAGPMLSNLSRGQISLFIGLLVLLDAARLIPPRWQGIATGIAAATTLAPLAFVPYLWLTNRRRAAVVSVATFAGCTGIGWLVAPRDSARYWLMGLWQGDHPDLSSSVSDLSIRGILTTFGLHGEFALLIWTILATLIACRALSRARQADAAGAHVLGAAIVGAMAMCLSPISGEYDAIWLVIAIVATPWSAPRRWLYWTTIVFLVVSVLRPISVIEFAIYASHTVTTAIVAVVVAKAEGFFAVAIACLVPFQALRNNEPPRQNPPYAGLQSEPTAPV